MSEARKFDFKMWNTEKIRYDRNFQNSGNFKNKSVQLYLILIKTEPIFCTFCYFYNGCKIIRKVHKSTNLKMNQKSQKSS